MLVLSQWLSWFCKSKNVDWYQARIWAVGGCRHACRASLTTACRTIPRTRHIRKTHHHQQERQRSNDGARCTWWQACATPATSWVGRVRRPGARSLTGPRRGRHAIPPCTTSLHTSQALSNRNPPSRQPRENHPRGTSHGTRGVHTRVASWIGARCSWCAVLNGGSNCCTTF